MLMRWFGGLLGVVLALSPLQSQAQEFNYSESKVPQYQLPDPLLMLDGTRVETAGQWTQKRRAEVHQLFTTEMYGRSPGRPEGLHFETLETSAGALGGTTVRKQVRVYFSADKAGPAMDILIYHPPSSAPRYTAGALPPPTPYRTIQHSLYRRQPPSTLLSHPSPASPVRWPLSDTPPLAA